MHPFLTRVEIARCFELRSLRHVQLVQLVHSRWLRYVLWGCSGAIRASRYYYAPRSTLRALLRLPEVVTYQRWLMRVASRASRQGAHRSLWQTRLSLNAWFAARISEAGQIGVGVIWQATPATSVAALAPSLVCDVLHIVGDARSAHWLVTLLANSEDLAPDWLVSVAHADRLPFPLTGVIVLLSSHSPDDGPAIDNAVADVRFHRPLLWGDINGGSLESSYRLACSTDGVGPLDFSHNGVGFEGGQFGVCPPIAHTASKTARTGQRGD